MRTEHRLRMAFEPDYAEKYEELRAYRRSVRDSLREVFLDPKLLVLQILLMFLQVYAYKNPAAALIQPALLLAIWGPILIIQDIMRRKSLGL